MRPLPGGEHRRESGAGGQERLLQRRVGDQGLGEAGQGGEQARHLADGFLFNSWFYTCCP